LRLHPRINVDNFSAIVFATDYGFEAAAFVFGNTAMAIARKIYLRDGVPMIDFITHKVPY